MESNKDVMRMSLAFRVQHILLFSSAIVLGATGYMLVIHSSSAGKLFINLAGGYESRALIHRISAIVLIAVCLWHFLYIMFSRKGHDEFMKLMPGLKDVKDFLQTISYYFGRDESVPRYDKFNFIQKFQYWGVMWGMIAMILSGLVLWFKNISMSVIPKWSMDVLIALHGYEGVVAFLVLFLWHQYNVHLNPIVFPMDKVWLTGRIDIKRLEREHPLEYETLETEVSVKKRRIV